MLLPLPKLLHRMYDKDSLVYQDDNTIYYNTEVDKDLIDDINNKDFQVYNGTYLYEPQFNSPKIHLVGRGRNCGKKKFKIEGFLPYCYISSDNGEYKTYLGQKVDKIMFHLTPKTVGDFRKLCEKLGQEQPLEADLLFVRRFLLDTYDFFKPNEYVEPKVCIMDLETDFPYDNNRIISFAINGYDDYLYYNSKYDTSNYWELILDAYEQLLPYDIWTNWNVEFDYSVLNVNLMKLRLVLNPVKDGMEMYKDDYIRHCYKSCRGLTLKVVDEMMEALLKMDYLRIGENGYIEVGSKELVDELDLEVYPLDMLSITKKMIAREITGRWSLDNVGIQTCGIGKVEYDKRYVRDLDEETLFQYNVLDVIVPDIIDNEYGGVECHVILAWSLHQMIKDVLITAVVNDVAMLREYHKDEIVLPSRPPHGTEDEETYKAAEPSARPGVYKSVMAFDLSAAYPSAVLAINASCESKDDNGCYMAPNGIKFNKTESTFIRTLKSLMAERYKVKNELKTLDKRSKEWRTKKFIDFALKTQVAAFSHGIFGWTNSRMKDKSIADAITSTVRDILDCAKDKLDELGYPWIYTHTDAVYFCAPKEKSSELHKLLNETIKEHCDILGYGYTPYFDYKGFYPKAYIHSPARNVLVDEDGEWETTGMSYMRSDTPKVISDIEIELIKMKLNEKSMPEMLDYLKSAIEDLREKNTTDIGLIKPLNKKLDQYGRITNDGKKGAIPFHIKALLFANEEYGFEVAIGEKYMILPIIVDEWEGVRKIKRVTTWIAYDIDEGLPDMYDVDWRAYLRSCLYGKVCRLFNMTPRQLEKQLNIMYKYTYEK
jgi:DNA polymerase elongation subunit (family B)